jgi:hypothetical protein
LGYYLGIFEVGLRIVSVLAKIPSKGLPKTDLECYLYFNLLARLPQRLRYYP